MDETDHEDTEETETEAAAEAPEEHGYAFEGYRIELFEKVGLTPPSTGEGQA